MVAWDVEVLEAGWAEAEEDVAGPVGADRAKDQAVARGPGEAVVDGGDKMKVCIPTMGNGGMEEAISQHFGRAPTFTLVDLNTKEVHILPNRSNHMGGKGLPTDMLRDQGVQVMIVGGLGPKAIQAFAQQCVEVFVGATGTVNDAIVDWKEGLLTKASFDNACNEHRH
jgi:predicted Fe-Mo cluster-binding NifX family protein